MGSIADIYRNITLWHDLKMFSLFKKKTEVKVASERIYLDHASATPLRPEVLAAMMPYFTSNFGNPSAIHTEGQMAKQAVNDARAQVARVLGVQSDSITFTSGGTESNNLAILGAVSEAQARSLSVGDMEIITTKIEHPATLKTVEALSAQGVSVKYVPVDATGKIIREELKKLLTAKTLLVSVAYVNSEIGTIEDLGAVARVLRAFSASNGGEIIFHVDAAQAPLWLPCDLIRHGADLLSLDAGKFGGPKGVGVLARGKHIVLKNISYGGGQERGLRPGTESVPAIVGFANALVLAQNHYEENTATVSSVRDYFIAELQKQIPTAILNGTVGEARVANNINISIPGIDSEFTVVTLDVAGIACSTKSACSSAGGGASVVVKEVTGDQNRANSTLRFSLGVDTTKAEIEKPVAVLAEHIKTLPISATEKFSKV